jgi:apolipoprotein N-acyltransferase
MRRVMEAIGLARLTPGDIDFQPGPGPRTLALPGMPSVGGQICYEIIFAGAVVDPVHRPNWLANISNDAWFGPTGPPQHLAQTRLRALEEGLPVARATPTGISAVIDARGHVIAASRLGEAVTTAATLPSPLPPTPFARWGHLTSACLALILLIAGILLDRTRRASIE